MNRKPSDFYMDDLPKYRFYSLGLANSRGALRNNSFFQVWYLPFVKVNGSPAQFPAPGTPLSSLFADKAHQGVSLNCFHSKKTERHPGWKWKISCSISCMAMKAFSFGHWSVFKTWRNLKFLLPFSHLRGNFPPRFSKCKISQLPLLLWKWQSREQAVVERRSTKAQSSKLRLNEIIPIGKA